MSREMLLLVDALAAKPNKKKEIRGAGTGAGVGHQAYPRRSRRARFDRRNTGNYESFRRWQVVPDDEYVNEYLQVPFRGAEGRCRTSRLAILEEALEPIDFGRIGAQAAKQVILQKIRDAEREQILNDFLERKNISFPAPSSAWSAATRVIEAGKIEALPPRPDDPQGENLRVGDRVKAICCASTAAPAAPRSSCRARRPNSSSACSKLEVPEISDGLMEMRPAPATPVCAPRSPSSPTTRASTRSAPASACAVRASPR